MANESDAEVADRDRLALLFAEYSIRLTRFAVRRVGPAAAGDVVSETFLVAWRRRAEIPIDRPGPWLFAVAANVIRHEIRGSVRRTSLRQRGADELNVTPAIEDEQATQIAERLLVHQTLAQMSDQDQEVLRLAEWDQLTSNEAAIVLECSAAAFKVRLHRARRRFAARLVKAQADGLAGDRTTGPQGPFALRQSADDLGVTP